jgi:hypothetical protein
MSARFSELDGYEISGCSAYDKNLITFWGQQWPTNDSLDTRPTSVFFYYADEPEADQWALSGVADATGIHGCAAYLPFKQWVYVLDDGEVYVVGRGFDDFEEKITSKKHSYFNKIKSIRSGHAIAVGPRRKVFIRDKPNSWRQLDNGLFPLGDATPLDSSGFIDIDGFGENEMYACGGVGDLWTYQDAVWQNIDIDTNASLTKICCSSDGNAYIATNRREVIVGRHHAWHYITQELTTDVFESIVDFKGRILISTEKNIYEVLNGSQFILAKFPAMPEMKSKAHMAVGADVLVVAGKDEAVMFDGKTWTRILAPK